MKRVLILEDNKIHMETLSTIIDGIGEAQVFKAYNVAEASYMLYLNDFDVFLIDIILDVENPGDISGIEFVNYLRGIKKYQFAPVIFITSLEDPKLSAYKDLRCFDFIEKPFSKDYVINTVKQAFEFPKVKESKEFAFFRKEGLMFSVKIEDITHIVVGRTGVDIYTIKDIMKLGYHTISDILKILDSDGFLMCSRNTIVNKKYIEYVDFSNRYIKLIGVESPVEIGAIMKKYFKESLKELD